MKAVVDPDLCTSCELCTELCPDVFEMGDEAARVKVKEVPAAHEDATRDAAEQCPAEAIKITE